MDVERYIEDGFDQYAIAAAMVTTALWMYRTTMTQEDYEYMAMTIYNSRNFVSKGPKE